MADTFTNIQTVTVGSGGAASIDFTSIPQTYTDLVLKISTRYNSTNQTQSIKFNSDSTVTNYYRRMLGGDNSGPYGYYINDNGGAGYTNLSTDNANTFSANEIYIPGYTNTGVGKAYHAVGGTENNTTTAFRIVAGNYWTGTSAISSISLLPGSGLFSQYSSATLYGI